MLDLRSGGGMLLVVLGGIFGCDRAGPTGPDGDAGADLDADGTIDADAPTDSDLDVPQDGDVGVDADVPSGPGPFTLLGTDFEFVMDRLCDFDGDGDLDNAIADLGSPAGDMVAMTINSALRDTEEHHDLLLMHMPRVDDLSGPDVDDGVLIVTMGRDTDVPPDPDDDLSGEEPFYAETGGIDACGEPTTYFEAVRLSDGELLSSRGHGAIEFPGVMPLVVTAIQGRIEPGGGGGRVVVCSYSTIHDLGGASTSPTPGSPSMLEGLLGGGAPMGMPGIPGLTPDVDLDGDGLERFTLDADYRIASCIDGDLTVISGRDCWRDDRMADAISMIPAVTCVGARFAGLPPGWELTVEGTCEDPPEQSLWGGD